MEMLMVRAVETIWVFDPEKQFRETGHDITLKPFSIYFMFDS